MAEGDVAGVASFILEYKRETGKEPGPEVPGLVRAALLDALADPTALCLVRADEDGRALGYLVAHVAHFPMVGGRELYVSDLFIRREARGGGLGRALLACAEEEARVRSCVRVMLNNPKDSEGYRTSFYAKNGNVERTGFANFVKPL